MPTMYCATKGCKKEGEHIRVTRIKTVFKENGDRECVTPEAFCSECGKEMKVLISEGEWNTIRLFNPDKRYK